MKKRPSLSKQFSSISDVLVEGRRRQRRLSDGSQVSDDESSQIVAAPRRTQSNRSPTKSSKKQKTSESATKQPSDDPSVTEVISSDDEQLSQSKAEKRKHCIPKLDAKRAQEENEAEDEINETNDRSKTEPEVARRHDTPKESITNNNALRMSNQDANASRNTEMCPGCAELKGVVAQLSEEVLKLKRGDLRASTLMELEFAFQSIELVPRKKRTPAELERVIMKYLEVVRENVEQRNSAQALSTLETLCQWCVVNYKEFALLGIAGSLHGSLTEIADAWISMHHFVKQNADIKQQLKLKCQEWVQMLGCADDNEVSAAARKSNGMLDTFWKFVNK